MTRPNDSLRRSIALLGAVLTGLATLLTGTAPASAADPTLMGTVICDTSIPRWTVIWYLDSGEDDLTGTITKVVATPAGSEMSGDLVVGAEVPPKGKGRIREGRQLLPAGSTATSAQLMIEISWERNGTVTRKEATGSVKITGTCRHNEAKPDATATPRCDRTLLVTLIDAEDALMPAHFQVFYNTQLVKDLLVDPGKRVTLTVPADAGPVHVFEKNRSRVWDFTWHRPADCNGPGGNPGGDGGSLPVTGPAAGAIAGGAALLLAIGAGLLLMARRRRVRFTA